LRRLAETTFAPARKTGLEVAPKAVENQSVAQGSASAFVPAGEYRPSPGTASWSLAVTAGWIALAIGLHDLQMLFPGAMCFALWLQCRQRLVVEGRSVYRVGLRPTTLDLNTAEIVATGGRWWHELFFLGHSLQLRDADGHRLYLESWLWEATIREAFVEAIADDPHS
jgi:hypothetical protein